jgi:hypothetical protein
MEVDKTTKLPIWDAVETGMPSFAVVKAEDCSMGYSAKHWLGNLVARGILLQRPLCHRARLWRCSWVPPLGGQPWFDARYAEMRPDASEGCTVEGWLACESGLKRGSRVAQGKARQAVVPLSALTPTHTKTLRAACQYLRDPSLLL